MSKELDDKRLLEGLMSLLQNKSIPNEINQEDCMADEDWQSYLKSKNSRHGRRELDNPWEHMKKIHRRHYKQRAPHKSLREMEDSLADMLNDMGNMIIKESDKNPNLSKLPAGQADAIKGALSLPAISQNTANGSSYLQYRFGIALAGSPEYPTQASGAFAGDPLLSTYTDEEIEIVNSAAKFVGAGPVKKLSSNTSTELSNTNTTSAVAKIKRNKYGI